MRNQDFIITGLQSWDIPVGSNAIDIAKEISNNNRVLYVNSPLDVMTIYRNKPTPFQGSTACGSFHLRSPTGGLAKGTPK